MAHARDDSFHYPLRELPLHSRGPSTTSDWNGNFDRPTTSGTDRAYPYRVSEFADSSRGLVLPGYSDRHNGRTTTRYDDAEWQPSPTQNSFGNIASPTRQAFLPEGTTPPASPGSFHPGFPRPETPSSPYDSPLAVPANAAHARSQSGSSLKSVYNEYFRAIPQDEHSTPRKEAVRPAGPPGGPPPDGGTTAWLQVLGGYFLFFNTWGLINAFGVFQTYYKGTLLLDTSNSSISWIGTLTSFFLCASPISWGPVFDVGNPRLLVLFGSFSVVFGIMMTSLCEEYWQLILAQGVCCGIGGGCLFITATSILPSYFSSKRALVMGISASGSSLGGVVYPLIFKYVQPTELGFGWAVRIIGFIAILTLAIPCIVIKPRVRPPGRRKIFDASILKEVPFQIMNLATFFGFVGQYIPYFFIEQYAANHGLGMEFWMLIFLNIGSIPGRIVPSYIGDKYFHPLKVLATTTASATLLAFCWIGIKHSTAGLVVWCFLYGFFSGAFVSLQGAAVASMTKDLRTIGTRFGINMFAGALGILIGSPVGGAIFPTSWPGAQSFCGATLACATACIVACWFAWQAQVKREKGLGEKVEMR
ncbi:Putative major facilitator superfamily, MFS transporter superfamily [Septoria linicola]|uniref:Major facilitator superfamily, MFS transporter superfamily n=1 Tax=Septoria linicola TaxID=215465 RepID=A0A9Q9AUW6_9PEZI|nr:putative major facilitator superfamily, MFS transporter superfamily [Septoria linicola]USW56317.1 Putative major facilitator superfamily, MFS transporter superfamily [Septoria linicola]